MGADEPTPTLATEELGERSVTLNTDHADALAEFKEAATGVGFSVVAEFSPADRINDEHDVDVGPYTVLGLGVPAAAEHALDAGDPRVGALFPCRAVIREVQPGRQEVYHLDTMRLAQQAGLAPDNERWTALVAQLEQMIDDVFASLGRQMGGETRYRRR
jgi:uncharacterized protein (DUF302 family)